MHELGLDQALMFIFWEQRQFAGCARASEPGISPAGIRVDRRTDDRLPGIETSQGINQTATILDRSAREHRRTPSSEWWPIESLPAFLALGLHSALRDRADDAVESRGVFSVDVDGHNEQGRSVRGLPRRRAHADADVMPGAFIAMLTESPDRGGVRRFCQSDNPSQPPD